MIFYFGDVLLSENNVSFLRYLATERDLQVFSEENETVFRCALKMEGFILKKHWTLVDTLLLCVGFKDCVNRYDTTYKKTIHLLDDAPYAVLEQVCQLAKIEGLNVIIVATPKVKDLAPELNAEINHHNHCMKNIAQLVGCDFIGMENIILDIRKRRHKKSIPSTINNLIWTKEHAKTIAYKIIHSEDEKKEFASRQSMVKNHLLHRGISNDSVIAAFEKVPRHLFVSLNQKHVAYDNYPLPIGQAQTISQPYMVALMLEVAAISKTDIVLDIGTGSGYQAALISLLCKEVHTIEVIAVLYEKARVRLFDLGYHNITCHLGNAFSGLEIHAPYNVIIAAAATSKVPSALLEQLALDGKLIIPLGSQQAQRLYCFTKTKNGIIEKPLYDCRFVPLINP